MDYYLSFIDGDFDNFSENCYLNGIKIDYQTKKENLKKYFNNLGFENIRFSQKFDIDESPNNNFFYVIKDISDFEINKPNEFDNNIIKRECLEYIRNYENCFLIYILESEEVRNKMQEKIHNFCVLNNIKRNKIMSFINSEITYELIKNLSDNVDYDTFNIVYERWSDDGNTYYPNLSDNTDGMRYRIQTGLFRFYNLYNKVRNVHIDLVKKYKNQNFFYFINGDQLDDHFKRYDKIPISDEVKKIHEENKNLYLIILNEHEYEKKDFILYVNELVLQMNIDAGRVYFITNNSKLQEYKKNYNLAINVFNLDFLLMFIANHMVNFGVPEFIVNKQGKFFMCHNRGPKSHRYGLLCMLKKENIIDEVDWSLILGWYRKQERLHHTDKNFYHNVFDDTQQNYYMEEINYFGEIDIKKSMYEQEKTWFDDKTNRHIEWKEVYEYKTYQDSFVNIVTESAYNDDEIHITEKSMKPFYFYQFPIFLSTKNHVKYLRERFGFDMFDDIIDHSYDNISDSRERLKIFFNEIVRINQNKEKFIEFYKNNKTRFEKNNQIVINIKNSTRDIEFFMNLKNKKIK